MSSFDLLSVTGREVVSLDTRRQEVVNWVHGLDQISTSSAAGEGQEHKDCPELLNCCCTENDLATKFHGRFDRSLPLLLLLLAQLQTVDVLGAGGLLGVFSFSTCPNTALGPLMLINGHLLSTMRRRRKMPSGTAPGYDCKPTSVKLKELVASLTRM